MNKQNVQYRPPPFFYVDDRQAQSNGSSLFLKGVPQDAHLNTERVTIPSSPEDGCWTIPSARLSINTILAGAQTFDPNSTTASEFEVYHVGESGTCPSPGVYDFSSFVTRVPAATPAFTCAQFNLVLRLDEDMNLSIEDAGFDTTG